MSGSVARLYVSSPLPTGNKVIRKLSEGLEPSPLLYACHVRPLRFEEVSRVLSILILFLFDPDDLLTVQIGILPLDPSAQF